MGRDGKDRAACEDATVVIGWQVDIDSGGICGVDKEMFALPSQENEINISKMITRQLFRTV